MHFNEKSPPLVLHARTFSRSQLPRNRVCKRVAPDLRLANNPLFAAFKLRNDGRGASCSTLFIQRRKKIETHSVSVELFEIDRDFPTAGEANLPRGFVSDTECEELRPAGANDAGGFRDDRSLDASAGNRAEKIPVAIDDEMTARRARRRTPGFDDGRDRDLTPLAPPFLRRGEDVAVGVLNFITHAIHAITAAQAAKPARH